MPKPSRSKTMIHELETLDSPDILRLRLTLGEASALAIITYAIATGPIGELFFHHMLATVEATADKDTATRWLIEFGRAMAALHAQLPVTGDENRRDAWALTAFLDQLEAERRDHDAPA